MVYLQAESYENGDSSLYGPEKLIEKDVVVVTFNYRLGLLGELLRRMRLKKKVHQEAAKR